MGLFKKAKKLVKKVTKPIVRPVAKKLVKPVARTVAKLNAPVVGVATLGLIKPARIGYKSEQAQTLYRAGGTVGKIAAGVVVGSAAVGMLKPAVEPPGAGETLGMTDLVQGAKEFTPETGFSADRFINLVSRRNPLEGPIRSEPGGDYYPSSLPFGLSPMQIGLGVLGIGALFFLMKRGR